MEEERINLSQRERDRLRVLHELEQGHLQQREAARRLRLSARQIRRLEARPAQEGDRGLVHRLRGRRSNCKIPEDLQQRALRQLRRPCYAGFGPTLAAEHLARNGVVHAATAGVLCGVATARLDSSISAASLGSAIRAALLIALMQTPGASVPSGSCGAYKDRMALAMIEQPPANSNLS